MVSLIWGVFLLNCIFGISNGELAPIAARLPLRGTPAKPGSPWPMPANHTMNPNGATISSRGFGFMSSIQNCGILNTAFSRYNANLLFRDIVVRPVPNTPILSQVEIIIPESTNENLCSEYPRLVNSDNTDDGFQDYERYSISIIGVNTTTAKATITASTVWGALRGIETFSQLIWRVDYGDTFFVNFTEISDAPRFPHRGYMMDTARHYIDIPVIKTVLDGMSYNKLNVFHWHASDDQSFPFVSKTFPQLSEKGAYVPQLTYEPEEVQEIIDYARDRGIRVILEFDTPGHTLVMGKSFPEILTPCYGDGVNPGTPNYTSHAAYEILDPTKNLTYDIMRQFFTEIKSVTKDSYVHLGMDEVYYNCWQSSPEIAAFMEKNNLTEYSQVQEYYTLRHLQMIKEVGLKPIIWHDPIDFGVEPEKDVLIQVWKGGDSNGAPSDAWIPYLERVLEKGYQTVLSSCWYLNYISYGEAWRKYYECDPILKLSNITQAQKRLVLGGEAAIWAEYVDGTNLIQRLFPFVGAMAERLWSPEFPIDSDLTDDAMHRLDQHRCRMLWRGLQAQPIFNGYCFPEEKSKKTTTKMV